MAKEITIRQFDYSLVDKDTKSMLIWFAAEIRRQGVTHVESGIEMGKLFSESKELCGDKVFREWVETECGCCLRTAYNYITAYSDFGSCANYAQIELSAMYELTSNGKAKNKAMKLADKGVKVTHKMAKQLIEETNSNNSRKGAAPAGVTDDQEPAVITGEDGSTEARGTKPKETNSRRRGSAKEKPAVDYGKCPNCVGTKWEEDADGAFCVKCHHPHGEPAGDVDADRIATQRSKTIKTVEALMRAFGDLDTMMAKPNYDSTIETCKGLLTIAKEWK